MSIVKKNGNVPANWRSLWSDFFDSDRFFADDFFRKDLFPAVNVQENPAEYLVEVAVPGFRKEDFKVKVENGLLNISAEVKEEKEEKEKNYTRKEFHFNSFSRSFTLPENASEEGIVANYKEGILRLNLAKKTAASAKTQEIQVS